MVNAPSQRGSSDEVDSSPITTSSMNNQDSHTMAYEQQYTTLSPLELFQSFLKAQSTRSAISNELVAAFSETNITDAVLQKVIEISSVGLFEVKNECEAIITLLVKKTDSHNGDAPPVDAQAIKQLTDASKAIEQIEKERVAEETKRLQLLRIATLNKLLEEEQDDAISKESMAACMVEQRQKLENIKAASEISQRKVQELVEQINEILQDIREYVADALQDE